MDVPLGCQTRPWHEYSLEDALDGIAAAGFEIVGFVPQADNPLFSPEASEDDIGRLRDLLASRGLRPQMAITQPNLWKHPEEEAVSVFLAEMERGKRLGLEYFILCGISDETKWEAWFRAIEACLPRAAELDLQLLLKPHGGLSALAEDLRRAVDRFSHPNFGICYDPGNILYYTGEKPEDDLPKIVGHVRAMCIKDETGGKEGEVMITPGAGLVDFPRIFRILRDAGFTGPCWIECLGGKTLAEINEEAKKTREFLTGLLAGL